MTNIKTINFPFLAAVRRFAFPSLLALAMSLSLSQGAEAARLKDIAFFEGVRPNQLVGYGLVVGLDNTGDQTNTFTSQSIANMLNRMGTKFDSTTIKMVKNAAAVIVTAELPPFIKPGSKIDVLVSSLGDAKSLQGGTLISTPLKALDGSVYAIAQGPVALAGFTAGKKGASVVKNHQTAGKISDGAIIEKELPFTFTNKDDITLSLRNPDFTTARRISDEINKVMGNNVAIPIDSGGVRVQVPFDLKTNLVEYVSRLEAIEITPDNVTKVVVNERTGTVVIGENVRISTVAISHGDLSVEIKTQYLISQPEALSTGGTTVVVPAPKVEVKEAKSNVIVLNASVTLGDVVRALNLVGVTPRDLVAILQAIKAAGALQAELEII